MQQKGPLPPVGVMFDTALNRIDHALALAALYKLQSLRELRVASLSVSTHDVRTAAFCDVLARYLSGSSGRFGPAVGMTMTGRAAAPAPMVEAVLGRKKSDGSPQYVPGVQKLNDTADVAAALRNGISAQQPDNGLVVVNGPLLNIAAALALPDVMDLAPKRVRGLVIAATTADIAAHIEPARKVFSDWPTPIAVGEFSDLKFPGEQLETLFAWAGYNPVREAYQAFGTMPYNAPLDPAAAVVYAARPESAWFDVSEPGTVTVENNGQLRFAASRSGTHRMVRLAAAQRELAVQEIVALVSGPPPQSSAGKAKGKQEE